MRPVRDALSSWSVFILLLLQCLCECLQGLRPGWGGDGEWQDLMEEEEED